MAGIAPEEEIFRIIQPAGEEVDHQRHRLLRHFAAPVGARHFVNRRLDADLAESFLHQHRDRLADIAGAQIEGDRGVDIRRATLRHQRFSLGEVVGVAALGRPGDAGDRVGWAAEQRIGQAEHRRVHDLLIGQRPGHGLAYLDVVERRFHDVELDRIHAIADRIRDDDELALFLHFRRIFARKIERDVGVAPFHQGAAVALRGDRAPDHLLELRQLAADPVVIALVHGLDAGLPARHLVGAAAGGVALGVFERPRILLGGVLFQEPGIVDARHDHREIGDGQAVFLDEVDAHGVVVDHHELLFVEKRACLHLNGRKAADADGAVERPFDVCGGNRRAVLEFGFLFELEGDRHVADIHVFGEFR